MTRRFKRGLAGKRNRRRRQTAARIGIVRRIALQVGFADSAFIRIAHAIDDSRVSLQAHADIQAVDEYGGHMGRGRLRARFLFQSDSP